jgi:hypothetical protein
MGVSDDKVFLDLCIMQPLRACVSVISHRMTARGNEQAGTEWAGIGGNDDRQT